jgi:hypothetical protein
MNQPTQLPEQPPGQPAVRASMRVLVCGGRSYDNRDRLFSVLDQISRDTFPIGLIIHGGAPGADTLAKQWAESRRVTYWAFPAQWAKHGPAAGPIRNAEMLEEAEPDIVVAFPGGSGTADMKRRAVIAGVKVLEVEPEGQEGQEAQEGPRDGP